jgi:3-deoxy-manno-octulosonate cytidylyltransferase (CMP-KDO synthetase)
MGSAGNERREGAGRSTLAALAIVPARLGSTRLPRKMLLRETGQYLFEHTCRNAQRSGVLERVVLATDSREIQEAAAGVGIEALLTSPEHTSGTDRVNEAYLGLRARGEGPWDVVLNVQGDEPELPHADLAPLVAAFRDPEVELATLAATSTDARDLGDPNVVKVVLDERGDALYFSRAPIPVRHGAAQRAGGPDAAPWRRHLGVYAFRPEALARFCSLPRGELERAESLEQLRWLEAGRRIRVLPARTPAGGIDTPEHYARFVARCVRGEGLRTT